jgi:hypothetical protein
MFLADLLLTREKKIGTMRKTAVAAEMQQSNGVWQKGVGSYDTVSRNLKNSKR